LALCLSDGADTRVVHVNSLTELRVTHSANYCLKEPVRKSFRSYEHWLYCFQGL